MSAGVFVLDTPTRSWHTAGLAQRVQDPLMRAIEEPERQNWPAPVEVEGRTPFEQPNLLLRLDVVQAPPADESDVGLHLGDRCIGYVSAADARAMRRSILELQDRNVTVWCRAKFVPASPDRREPWLLYESDRPGTLRSQLRERLRVTEG
jgi:hypothetical protein